MYWTKPLKINHKWRTTNFSNQDRMIGYKEFNDKEKCLKFLRTINIYIDGELCYNGE